MYTADMCRKEFKEQLEKLLENKVISTKAYSSLELELTGVKVGCVFTVYVCDKKFHVDITTEQSSLQYIYQNLDKITYIQNKGCFFDTLVGDICIFIVEQFGLEEYSADYFIAIQFYEQFIENSATTPEINKVISYIKERV